MHPGADNAVDDRSTPDTTFAVTTDGLTKRFGDRPVVDQLDLVIPTGSVCGFVGPNGAGKTTTIRMLLGLIRPSAGTGTVLGRPLTDPASYLDRVGALIEAPAFYPALSGFDNLLVLARLGRLDRAVIAPALRRVGLSERGGDVFRRYSLGMKQRLGIAAALLNSPSLLLLDEPTNGLDPGGILEMRSLVRSLAADGTTVFVSSHLLSEVEQICDHLVMIRHGRLAFQGSVAQLDATVGTQLIIRPERADQIKTLLRLVADAGLVARLDDDLTSLVVEARSEWAARLNRLAMGADITLVQIGERRQSLEQTYFDLTGTHSGDRVSEATLEEIQ